MHERLKQQHVVFEMSGGNMALDLTNTYSRRRSEHPTEWFVDFGDLIGWGAQAGILSRVEARQLAAKAEAGSAKATAAVRRARELRENLYAALSAIAHRRPPPVAALAGINREVKASYASGEITFDADGATLQWSAPQDLSDRILWHLGRAAAELLLAPASLQRVRECECAWLFLDLSRNHTRRWCDMRVCGNRAKVKRFRLRKGA